MDLALQLAWKKAQRELFEGDIPPAQPTPLCNFLAFLLRKWLAEDLTTTLGVLAGGHTQPACLAYSEDLLRELGPEFRQGINVGYAAVFPVAMVAKILIGTSLLQMLPH